MVEHKLQLDLVFSSLADPTRRDVLKRVAQKELSVGAIADHYDLTFAAVSKHLRVLERARLVTKRRRGKQQFVGLSPGALEEVSDYLETYRTLWEERLDRLDALLKEDGNEKRTKKNRAR